MSDSTSPRGLARILGRVVQVFLVAFALLTILAGVLGGTVLYLLIACVVASALLLFTIVTEFGVRALEGDDDG